MQKLSRRTRWLYGAGDLGFSLTSTIIGAYFAIFLTDVVGIKPATAAIAIFIGRPWDYVTDPLIGYISSKTSRTSSWVTIFLLLSSCRPVFEYNNSPSINCSILCVVFRMISRYRMAFSFK